MSEACCGYENCKTCGGCNWLINPICRTLPCQCDLDWLYDNGLLPVGEEE